MDYFASQPLQDFRIGLPPQLVLPPMPENRRPHRYPEAEKRASPELAKKPPDHMYEI